MMLGSHRVVIVGPTPADWCPLATSSIQYTNQYSYQPKSRLSSPPPRNSMHYTLRHRQHDRQLIPKTTKLRYIEL